MNTATTDNKIMYTVNATNFFKIPGSPIAYWASARLFEVFVEGIPLGNLANVPKGLSTGSVDMFVRLWHEVSFGEISYSTNSCKETIDNQERWYPYAKGGEYRKWYGNLEYIVNWFNDGYNVKSFVDLNGKQRSRPQNTSFYFKKCLTYSAITSYKLSLRYLVKSIFGGGGDSVHVIKTGLFDYIFSFLNSKLQYEILNFISPTLNYEVDHLKKLPIIFADDEVEGINEIVQYNIQLSKTDWDSFETSWDFKRHPLI